MIIKCLHVTWSFFFFLFKILLILKVAFLFILSVDGIPQSPNQVSRFFSSELLSRLNHLINVKFLKIWPCLWRFLVKVFFSFEFSFLSRTADLTTQPLPLLRPTEFPSFPSLSSLGNNISAMVSLTEATKFGELRFLFLSSKFFFFFLVYF